MTARIAILTPDPGDEAWRGRWREVLERNSAPLRAAGASVEGRSWTGAGDLGTFDLVLPLLVWGYVRAHPSWIERVAAWERDGVRLRNPASVLRWNADKSYLGRLGGRGAPVVPSIHVERVTEKAMAEAARAFGTGRLVAKRRISYTAWHTIRWSPGGGLDGGPPGPAIIQPYLPAIETSGELSLIYFAGAFSHAVRKLPRAGDFRVQPNMTASSPPAFPPPTSSTRRRASSKRSARTCFMPGSTSPACPTAARR